MTGVVPTTAGDFWRFSVAFYARPGVAQACLALQDTCRADVNLLLFVIYLALQGRCVDSAMVDRMDRHIRGWRENAVQPLRALRRALKDGIPPIAAATSLALREAIKREELEAERLQQAALAQAFPAAACGAPKSIDHALAANLAAYAYVIGAPLPGDDMAQHFALLLQAAVI